MKKRKLLFLLLSLCMVFSLTPLAGFAAVSDGEASVTSQSFFKQ